MVLGIFQDKTKSKRCDIAMQKNESRKHCCFKGKGINPGTCYVIWAFSKRHASDKPLPLPDLRFILNKEDQAL